MSGADILSDALKKINEEAANSAPKNVKPRGKDEVNFDDISSSSSDEGEIVPEKKKENEEEDVEEPKKSVSELMEEIRNAKSEGNGHFVKDGEKENKSALKDYNKGLRTIEKVEDEPELKKNGELKTELDTLRISLLLNKAAVCNRLEVYKQAKIACSDILKMKTSLVTPAHKVKAYLRRGQANLETGYVDDAKRDFLAVLKIEKTNREAGKKLRQIKELLIAQRKREKEAYSNFLSKKGLDLYGDQEDEKSRSLEEYEKYKSAHQRLLGSQKLLTFEQYKRQSQEEKKQMDGRLLKEETDRARREKALKESPKPTEEIYQDKDVELDETDLKVLKEVKEQGYYNSTRKDAPVESIKRPLGPAKLASDEAENRDLVKSDSVQSSWNKGKTWEEKDIAAEARNEVESKLVKLKHSVLNGHVKVDKVSRFSGDVHQVFVSGKEGAVYDVSLEVKFKGSIVVNGNEKKLSGKLSFGEIANGLNIKDPQETECKVSYASSLLKLEDHAVEKQKFIQAVSLLEKETREIVFDVLEGKYLTA